MERTVVLPLHEYNRLIAVNRAITEGKKVFIGSFALPYESGMHQSYEGLAFTSDEAVIKQSEEIERNKQYINELLADLSRERITRLKDEKNARINVYPKAYPKAVITDAVNIDKLTKFLLQINKELNELNLLNHKKKVARIRQQIFNNYAELLFPDQLSK